ncbi:biotin carboxyl carrier protein of acetyl-CoA carboxylase-like isoform X1 [Salvia splendens]|uniref:biotin carboxyl carrier protein of acetyl-CoA carboxylase-like isoform X1 n=1 Tax=Salvia splendens TaxID=180675 RepID=UPI00110234BD|nr:biotin carboxyl carrier protein of acetyl-CoA carboxylase-like isoform X1 [Salvia splendens]
MESAAVLRSFDYAVGTNSHIKSVLHRPGIAAYCDLSKLPAYGGKNLSSRKRHAALLVSCAKTSEATISAKGDPNGAVLSDKKSNGAVEKKAPITATFPTGFETLLTEVCDETKIAELKVKLGAFEIHMKRNIDCPAIPAPVIPHATESPVPSKPAVPPPPQSKSSAKKVSSFTNVSAEKAAKLAALDASGSSGYVIVSSPTVGSFRRARTLKGKKQPPACKEGDLIKEGQVIGFLDQFGSELPVKSDVAGEVLKLLFSDGEAVGYGEPLVAVLPSFRSIK